MVKFSIAPPRFDQVLVEDNLQDGYWLEAVDINGNGKPDLVASGLAEGNVVWYENPSWKKRSIATFSKPVALDHGDIDGDGRMDLVVCHDYGKCMFNCRPQDGKISWIRNPRSYDNGETWEVRPIGDLLATHRLRLGHFTQNQELELIGMPVVGPQGGPDCVHKPVRITHFSKPDDLLAADAWSAQVIDEGSFRVIHGVIVDRFNPQSNLESMLLASEEGLSWFYFENGDWQVVRLGEGEQTQYQKTGFKGSGNIAIGRIGDDPYAYMTTVEPFHGNTVAVYHKGPGASLSRGPWKRTVLDVYADPNEHGEGPGHHVMTGDFDGDGDDEFLVALRGPMPWQGVFYYKAIDLENGLWVKSRISSSSAARIAVADFDGDGRLDFATTGYYTPGYFLADRPQVLVFLNRIGD